MGSRCFLILFLIFMQILGNNCNQIWRKDDDCGVGNRRMALFKALPRTKRCQWGTKPNGGCYETTTCGGYKWSVCDFKCPNDQSRCCGCNPPCFSAKAQVDLQNGKSLTMSELQVGDSVQIASSDGSLMYSEVRTFLKRQRSVTSMYKSITTSSNKTIRLSGNHPVYARRSSTDKFNPIIADEISTGDGVLVQDTDMLTPETVTNVSTFRMQGAYVPLTMEGNIVVDGVLASCYPSSDHEIAHIIMAPVRWFPGITQWIFGEDNGWSVCTKISDDLSQLVSPLTQLNIRSNV